MARRKGFPRVFWRQSKRILQAAVKEGHTGQADHERLILDHVQEFANAHQVFRLTAKSVLNACRADLVKDGEYVLVGGGVMKHRNDLTDEDIIIVTSRREKSTLGSLLGNARWLHRSGQIDACVRHLRFIAEVWPDEAQVCASELELQL